MWFGILDKFRKPKLISMDADYFQKWKEEYEATPYEERIKDNIRHLIKKSPADKLWLKKLEKQLLKERKLRIKGFALMRMAPGEDEFNAKGYEGVTWEDVSVILPTPFYVKLWSNISLYCSMVWEFGHFIKYLKYFKPKEFRDEEFSHCIFDIEDVRFQPIKLSFDPSGFGKPSDDYTPEQLQSWNNYIEAEREDFEKEKPFLLSYDLLDTNIEWLGTGPDGLIESDLCAAVKYWVKYHFDVDIEVEWVENS